MKFRSIFDIIGPIMIGPSSSHTAGAVRIGLFTRKIFKKEPKTIRITLFGSFKETYKGHGTDIALIGGLLGYDTFDTRIRNSLKTAKEKNIDFKFIESDIEHIHPNIATIAVMKDGERLEVSGKSIGGGKMVIFEIQGFEVEVSADFPTLFIFYKNGEDYKKIIEEEIKKLEIEIINFYYSSSIIEGKNLLVVETKEETTLEKIEKLKDCSAIYEIKSTTSV